jgi:ParB family chromosome partitioning protein
MKTMAKFDLKGLLNDRSVPDRQQDQKIVYRNPKDLIPSEENFYNTEKLERLKQSIKLLGILQPLLIENRDGKDYVIAGHCRRKCCIDLLNEGNDRFSRVPCIYKTHSELEQDAGQEDDIVRQIMIIQANCYRDKSDWEKMTETLKMEGLVKELREKTPMEGKTRDILKDLIGTSGGQLGRYHAINTNLCEQLMSEFEEDRIKISVAYEASKLNREYQKQACELYEETGILTLDDIRDLYRQQEAEKGIPGQMTIETATGQNRPPEDDTEIPAETQIERFYESTNKNMKNYIIQEDKNMTIFMLSNLYGSARVRNGHLNYQGSTAGITFNPGGVFEHELSWQSLAKILIRKYGHKKPVKMVPVDIPEKTEDTISAISAAVKAFCGAYPEKLKTIMRICRLYNNNGDAARAAQKRIAPYGYHGCTGPEVGYTFMGFNAGLEIEIGKEKVSMKYGKLIAEAKKLYDPWDSKFDEEERCQSVAETPDEKQHDSVEDTKTADHFGDTTDMPDAWPPELKDIPIPTEIEITGYLYDEERKLREILEVEKEEPGMPRMEIMRQQLITAGLRLIKNLVKDCREE